MNEKASEVAAAVPSGGAFRSEWLAPRLAVHVSFDADAPEPAARDSGGYLLHIIHAPASSRKDRRLSELPEGKRRA